ncbi:putative N-formylglutamate amidohydrolase [Salegentibacter sp. 24]|uniref:N-formylglutamate amidohydrolase n=1 Tax=Salegentibacter sp. 24 TaxID=2183986 RepID=UPI00105F33A3|nr:N-formylglutamate amidohydrolase [Salegentibacter sp. 24]TDN85891.1 putative N-formylglutamate amidohydrolase [Salegentibacter sp. 24]
MKLVLTCEHAFNSIPQEYKNLFINAEEVLESHRGYDPGALNLFRKLEALASFTKLQEASRLLIEVNRSKAHPYLFSEFTRKLSLHQKSKIFDQFYLPYRRAVEKKVLEYTRTGEKVLHLSVHTFTPELNGNIRNTDIGILYNPKRQKEKAFSRSFKGNLQYQKPDLKVRFNYPYLGKADGFTTYLRKKFPENYLGIELEVNQKFVSKNQMDHQINNAVFWALKGLLK